MLSSRVEVTKRGGSREGKEEGDAMEEGVVAVEGMETWSASGARETSLVADTMHSGTSRFEEGGSLEEERVEESQHDGGGGHQEGRERVREGRREMLRKKSFAMEEMEPRGGGTRA